MWGFWGFHFFVAANRQSGFSGYNPFVWEIVGRGPLFKLEICAAEFFVAAFGFLHKIQKKTQFPAIRLDYASRFRLKFCRNLWRHEVSINKKSANTPKRLDSGETDIGEAGAAAKGPWRGTYPGRVQEHRLVFQKQGRFSISSWSPSRFWVEHVQLLTTMSTKKLGSHRKLPTKTYGSVLGQL